MSVMAVPAFAALFSIAGPAHGSIEVVFSNGDQHESLGVGGTASYTDPMSSVTATLTNRGFTDTSGNSASLVGFLNANAPGLGIDSGSGDPGGATFNPLESWTFDFNVPAEFLGIDVGSFTTTGGESFTISSPDWVGLVGVVPGSGSVEYDSLTGAFTLENQGTSDDFTLADLSGSVTLGVSAGSDITIAYNSSSTSGNAVIQDITFAFPASTSPNTVPEPGSFLVWSLIVCCSAAALSRTRSDS